MWLNAPWIIVKNKYSVEAQICTAEWKSLYSFKFWGTWVVSLTSVVFPQLLLHPFLAIVWVLFHQLLWSKEWEGGRETKSWGIQAQLLKKSSHVKMT